jgi:hypothetical protein
MTDRFILALSEDRFSAADAQSTLDRPCNRVLYVVEGAITVDDGGRARQLARDEAALFTGSPTVTATVPGTVTWRWELLPVGEEAALSPVGSGVSSSIKLAPEIPLPPGEPLLIRCDRVDFPLGSETPKHTHQGPGIRCLLSGEVVATIGAETATYRAGGAWLERGPDPVIGRSSKTEATAFVRVMVLPRRLKGQSSFQAWDAAEAAKPRGVTYKLFVDEDIAL